MTAHPLPEIVPAFPLENAVLFPYTRLPLHIFEPRYVEMVNDVLGTHRCVAIFLLASGSETQGGTHPAFYPIGCVGRIVAFEEVTPEKYNIVMMGITRIEAKDVFRDRPYQQVTFQALEDSVPQAPDEANRLRAMLTETARSLLQAMGNPSAQIETMLKSTSGMPLEVVTNWACLLLNMDMQIKQRLLAMNDVAQRCREVTGFMKGRIEEMGRGDGPSRPSPEPSRLN